ncbi:DUF3168 domain-containing protein [Euryhalocaulis caribicus]|uniref:DUF3168 domain-containing protein n=1 Tax=Euryhalocaulis caribicus TaxID=1161401 RepID=UPI000399EBBF|nr:DUF3168 domain-containing protein [Euryhalocaulis caribicus]
MSSAFAVQRALHEALSADAGVTALLGDPPRLWDRPPREAFFPFASYGGTRSEELPDGLQAHRMTLFAWSRETGREEAASVIAAMRSALHHAALTLEDGTLVSLRAVYSDVLKSDGRTFQGVLRLRAVTEAE